jgi:hypothetical protein
LGKSAINKRYGAKRAHRPTTAAVNEYASGVRRTLNHIKTRRNNIYKTTMQTKPVTSISDYMSILASLGFKNCEQFFYRAEDKDCGYLSGLRFLGIPRTAQTDKIANEMIYGCVLKIPAQIEAEQMELFESESVV